MVNNKPKAWAVGARLSALKGMRTHYLTCGYTEEQWLQEVAKLEELYKEAKKYSGDYP